MCEGCYEEWGSPPITSRAEEEVADLVEEVYDFAPSGGVFHIVFDDWNIETDYIDWCLSAEAGESYSTDADPVEWALQIYAGLRFRELSETSRAAVLAEVGRRREARAQWLWSL